MTCAKLEVGELNSFLAFRLYYHSEGLSFPIYREEVVTKLVVYKIIAF